MKKKIIFIAFVIIAVIAILFSFAWGRIFRTTGGERDALNIDGGAIIKVNGAKLWVKEIPSNSKKPPLFVIPGGPGFSSNYLENNFKKIEKNRRVIYIDPRNSGRSKHISNLKNSDFSQNAKDINYLIKRYANSNKVDILAHSYGAVSAMNLMINYGEKINKVVLVSPVDANYRSEFSPIFFKIGLPPKDANKADEWFIKNSKEVFEDMIYNRDKLNVMDEVYANFSLMIKNETKDKYDYRDKLAKTNKKVLLIFGKNKEAALSNEKTQKHLQEIFNTKIKYIENSGHFSFAENNDAFSKEVIEFLDN